MQKYLLFGITATVLLAAILTVILSTANAAPSATPKPGIPASGPCPYSHCTAVTYGRASGSCGVSRCEFTLISKALMKGKWLEQPTEGTSVLWSNIAQLVYSDKSWTAPPNMRGSVTYKVESSSTTPKTVTMSFDRNKNSCGIDTSPNTPGQSCTPTEMGNNLDIKYSLKGPAK